MNECKQQYCDFVGSRSFEDDNGWSYEVWQAAQKAAFKRLSSRFKTYSDENYTGKQIALYIEFLSEHDIP